jgi:predicted metal-binding membrane protein
VLLLTAAGAIDRALAPRRAFAAVSILLFTASVAGTVAWCTAMAPMGEIPMHGGWSVSSTWTPTCGQTWAGAAASFVGMWVVMMPAMMLPSLAPLLWHRRLALAGAGAARPDVSLAWLVAGHVCAWAIGGIAVFALVASLVEAAMRLPALARAVPVSQGLVLLAAGAFQFTRCKAHHLACCREALRCNPHPLPAGAAIAWREGLRMAWHCSGACAGLTAVLLVAGVMDLHAMAAVAAAITGERLAPAGVPVARAVGAAVVASGLGVIARIAGLT